MRPRFVKEPPIILRMQGRSIGLMIAITMIAWGALLVNWVFARMGVWADISENEFANAATCYLVILVIVILVYQIRYLRVGRRARAAGYDVCANCLYSLRGLPDKHHCPECGEAYDRFDNQNLWRIWAKHQESM